MASRVSGTWRAHGRLLAWDEAACRLLSSAKPYYVVVAPGTLVTEGNHDSGAMITARFALEQGREVFVVSGSIFSPQSRWPFSLLRDGATPVASAGDVLKALNLTIVAHRWTLDVLFCQRIPANGR